MNALTQPHVWPFLGFLAMMGWGVACYWLGYSKRAMDEHFSLQDSSELNKRCSKVLERVEPI